MASIPPTWLSSIVQTHGAAQRNGVDRTRAAEETAAKPDFQRDLSEVISSDERDAQAFADGQGTGGYNRQADGEPQDGPAAEPPADGSAPRLDIQA